MARRTSFYVSLLCVLALFLTTALGQADAAKPRKGAAKVEDTNCPALKSKSAATANTESKCPADDEKETTGEGCKTDAAEKKEKEEDAKKKESDADTVKAKVEKLQIDVSLTGAIISEASQEVLFDPEAWTSWTIDTIVPHGTKVQKGDVILTFDSEKLSKRLSDMRAEMTLAEVRIRIARLEHETLLKLNEEIVQWEKRAAKIAREDRETYLNITRPLNIESAERRLDSAKFQVEYEEEELRQLEKMYEADDLVENSEEIVLIRARRSLDRAKFYLKGAQIEYDLFERFHQPRRDETADHNWKIGQIEQSKDRRLLPLALKKAKLDMQQAEKAHEKLLEQHENLQKDYKLLTLHAPTSGIVYYGRISHGKVSTTAHTTMAPRRPVTDGSILFTIIPTETPLKIEVNVEEKKLHSIQSGMRAAVLPTGFPGRRLKAKVESIQTIPKPCGYTCILTVESDDHPIPLVPGMTAKVVVFSYENKEAVTVPVKSLETDARSGKTFVYLPAKGDGEPRRVRVELGQRTSSKVEILSGIKADQAILEEPPEDE